MNDKMWAAAYSNNDIKIINKDILFKQTFFTIERYNLSFKQFNGLFSVPQDRLLLRKQHAVAVLLYNPHEDTVVMIEQFRIGAYIDNINPQIIKDFGMQAKYVSHSPWLLEIVAGMIEPGDASASETAKREALEEAGAKIIELEPICCYIPSCGASNETTAVYCGRIDNTPRHGGVFGLEHEAEDIKVHIFKTAVAFNMVKAGVIVAAAPIIALQWLELNKNYLLKKWG